MLVSLLRSLLLSLTLTLALELTFSALFGLRKPRDFLLVALVNLFTNPLVGLGMDLWYLQMHSLPPWYLTAVLELSAVLAEGLLYRDRLTYGKLHPFLLSALLNLISYTGGLIFSWLF